MRARSNRIKIHIHDFAGHPFQAELSNELANCDFEVTHSFFAHTGPAKALLQDIHKTGRISFLTISLNQKYEVHNLIKRVLFEIKLAAKLIQINRKLQPDLTIFANTPLIAATIFKVWTLKSKFILWHQDIFSLAVAMRFNPGESKQNALQRIQIKIVQKLEVWLTLKADQVVCISNAFLAIYEKWGVDKTKVTVIENWAPLDQIHFEERVNPRKDDLTFIYAGTLGLKHNPQLLVELVQELIRVGHDPRLLVISEGDGANYLRSKIETIVPIEVVGFVPISELNSLLAASNFALMLLEEDASEFSVPSKTYSYLAAGKCILAFAPMNNAASAAIVKAGGFVFEPSHLGVTQAVSTLKGLTSDEILKLEIRARQFAVENFDIHLKTNSFVEIIRRALNIK